MQQRAISDFFRPRKRPAEQGAASLVNAEHARPAEGTQNSGKHDDASAPDGKRAHADSTSAPRAESLPFLELCDVFDSVAATTKRLEIAAILRVFFRRLMDEHPADVATVVHLCLSRGACDGVLRPLDVMGFSRVSGPEGSCDPSHVVVAADL